MNGMPDTRSPRITYAHVEPAVTVKEYGGIHTWTLERMPLNSIESAGIYIAGLMLLVLVTLVVVC